MFLTIYNELVYRTHFHSRRQEVLAGENGFGSMNLRPLLTAHLRKLVEGGVDRKGQGGLVRGASGCILVFLDASQPIEIVES